jgi:hypothetical protein
MDKGIIIFFIIVIGLGLAAIYCGYQIWYTNSGAPIHDYCKYTIPIIYVGNQIALTNTDKCLEYLLNLDYKLIDKNGSYFILEGPK